MVSVVGFAAAAVLLASSLYLRTLYIVASRPLWQNDLAEPERSDLRWMEHSFIWSKLSEARPWLIAAAAFFTLLFGTTVALQSYVTVPMGSEGIVGAADDTDARVLPPGGTYAKWPWQESLVIDRSDRTGSVLVARGLFQTNRVSYTYRVPSHLVPAEEFRKATMSMDRADFLVKATLKSAANEAYEQMPSFASKCERSKKLSAELKKKWSLTLLEHGIELTAVSCE